VFLKKETAVPSIELILPSINYPYENPAEGRFRN
jgi:hypothetical protein